MLDQAHMTSLFENATEGIILTNGRGLIVLVNPAAERIFGYKAEELFDKPIETLIPERYKPKHDNLRHGFYQHPGNRVMGAGRDLFARKKDGSDIPVEISLSHYRKNDELFVIAFIVDITTRKLIEADMLHKKAELEKITALIRQMNAELVVKVEERTLILKEALQKLEQSQQELSDALNKEKQLNEIKSRFVSMASHEFRTPLSAVLSSASLLAKYTGAEEQEKRDKHINRIKGSVKHLNDILEDFLSLGRLDEGRVLASPASFNLHDEISDVLSEMKFFIKEGQQFSFTYTGSQTIEADKKLVRNIVINLLSNAIKFSKEGDTITIDVNVSAKETLLTVKDQGIGISDEDKEHLFSSFFRGANASNIQGTGLGLHIVKRYIDILGGEIQLESRLNEGTTVRLIFPSQHN
jgi:PAS domain S-box-containing protein